MKIILNGAPHEFPDPELTITQMLERLELGPQPVLVERNGQAVLKREFETVRLVDGDRIEIVRMVAGG